MNANCSDVDRAAALNWLWHRVMAQVGAMRLDRTGPMYGPGPDDQTMREAAQDDAFGWIDDCEARLGCEVSSARAALVDFMLARDGTPGDPDVAAALQSALSEARGQLHVDHPVRRGLLAMVGGAAGEV